MRHEWMVRSGSIEYVVVRGADVFLDESPRELSPSAAAARLPRLVLLGAGRGPSGGWEAAVSMLRLDGPALMPADQRDARALARRLGQSFLDRRLVALAFARPWGARLDPAALTTIDPAPEAAAAPVRSDPEDELTWVEIELLDSRGKPVPHEPFELVCADGEHRTGSTDSKGLALVADVAAGQCTVTFPGLDGREWKPK
ncbi:MAG: hypothetical protein H6825_10845 [Planctomycetes bacterium]|nr:hypothetical protein [Planctomycetota bacterium]